MRPSMDWVEDGPAAFGGFLARFFRGFASGMAPVWRMGHVAIAHDAHVGPVGLPCFSRCLRPLATLVSARGMAMIE